MEPRKAITILIECMLDADRDRASRLLGELLESGTPAQELLRQVLDPALNEVGRLWENRELSMAQAYVGARIAEDFLMRCLPSEAEGAVRPPKGVVVIGNIEDDFHALGRRMVGSFLRASGWEVVDLGNDVTAEVFVEEALARGAHIVGASAMMHDAAMNIRKLRELIDRRGVAGRLKLAVGGAVFNWRPSLVEEVGGDGTAENATQADALCARLLSEVRTEEGP